MEFLRRYWTQIKVQLGELDPKSKIIIGSLVVILLLVGYLTFEYAAAPEMVTITQFAGEDKAGAVQRLENAGISVETEGNQIKVPADSQLRAFAILAEANLLADDTSAAFDQYIRDQNVWRAKAQDDRAYLLAKQKVLGQMVRRMQRIRTADVMIDMPRSNPFGQRSKPPSASVAVVLNGGKMDKKLTEGIAGLVAGSVVGMKPQDVTIVADGRSYRVDDEGDTGPNKVIEIVRNYERDYMGKVANALSYIQGVIISVNVKVEATAAESGEKYVYRDSETLKKQQTQERVRENIKNAGEPGARANGGLGIDNASGDRTKETENSETTEYGSLPLTEVKRSIEYGGMPEAVGVTVNVPRTYFVSLYKQMNGPDAEAPDDKALQPIVDAQLAQIEEQIKPIIASKTAGTVRVTMVHDAASLSGMVSADVTGGGVFGVMESEWVKPAGLLALIAFPIALMLYMARKATQQPPLPSAEELAGVPPMLPSDEELVGEADDVDPSMTGVELDENEVRTRKLAEQISDMVRSNPREAAQIFNRWARPEE